MMSQAESGISWKPLYRVGGVAALITAVLIPLQIIVFIAWPPPLEGTASDWFTPFRATGSLVSEPRSLAPR